MFDTLLNVFNQRTTGEQTLILIVGGILLFALGIQVGKAAFQVFGG